MITANRSKRRKEVLYLKSYFTIRRTKYDTSCREVFSLPRRTGYMCCMYSLYSSFSQYVKDQLHFVILMISIQTGKSHGMGVTLLPSPSHLRVENSRNMQGGGYEQQAWAPPTFFENLHPNSRDSETTLQLLLGVGYNDITTAVQCDTQCFYF